MKLSISVPDPMWASVYADGDSPSEVVQEAIAVLIEKRLDDSQPFAKAPDREDFDKGFDIYAPRLAKVIESAGYRLQAAYKIGVELATSLDFLELDLIAGRSDLPSDLQLMLAENGHNSLPQVVDAKLWQAIGDWEQFEAVAGSESGLPDYFTAISSAFLAAVADGIQDTHRAVLRALANQDAPEAKEER